MEFKEGDKVKVILNNPWIEIDKKGFITEICSDEATYVVDFYGSVLLLPERYLKKINKKIGENMTLNVNIKTSGKEEKETDYRELVKEKLDELTGFKNFRIAYNDIQIDCFYNSTAFIKLGLLQTLIKGIARFYVDNGMGLSLESPYTWKDVYNKIKDIDSIEYNLEG